MSWVEVAAGIATILAAGQLGAQQVIHGQNANAANTQQVSMIEGII